MKPTHTLYDAFAALLLRLLADNDQRGLELLSRLTETMSLAAGHATDCKPGCDPYAPKCLEAAQRRLARTIDQLDTHIKGEDL